MNAVLDTLASLTWWQIVLVWTVLSVPVALLVGWMLRRAGELSSQQSDQARISGRRVSAVKVPRQSDRRGKAGAMLRHPAGKRARCGCSDQAHDDTVCVAFPCCKRCSRGDGAVRL